MLRARHRSKKRSSRKLSWRGSIAWRSLIPSSVSGSRSMKPAMSSRSNLRRRANCHRIGPSFGPSAAKPWAKKLPMPFAAFGQLRAHHAETRPLDRELEAVGRGLVPVSQLFGLLAAVEGRVDLDRAELARRIFELLAPAAACPDRRRRATAGRSSRRCRCGCVLRSHPHQRLRCYFAAAAGAGPGVMKSSTAFQLPSSCFLKTVR